MWRKKIELTVLIYPPKLRFRIGDIDRMERAKQYVSEMGHCKYYPDLAFSFVFIVIFLHIFNCQAARTTLADMTQLIFTRLPTFEEDLRHPYIRKLVRHIEDRAGTSRAGLEIVELRFASLEGYY